MSSVRSSENQRENERSFFKRSFLIALSGWCCIASQAVAADPTEYTCQGNKLSFLGREYNTTQNKTYFHYKASRGLLTAPLNQLEFILPNNETTDALSNIISPISNILSLDNSQGLDSILFSKLPFPLLDVDIDLCFLGNVGQDVVKLKAKNAQNGLCLEGTILGPKVLNVEVGVPVPGIPTVALPPTNGGTPIPGTPTPTPTITGSNPKCLLETDVLTATVGEPLNITIPVVDTVNNPLTVSYSDWPESARCSAPSGSTVQPGTILSVDWIPTKADIGTGKILPLKIQSPANVSVLCDLEVNVIEDTPPVLLVDKFLNLYQCQGLTTKIHLDASPSYDPEGSSLSFAWSTDCQQATFDSVTNSTVILSLNQPGQGIPQTCKVGLTISDGTKFAKTDLQLNVNACDVNCDASQKDSCGVCNGSNLCADCTGQINGGKVVDRCGVCGGTNSCIDCRGALNGAAQKDVCGICGGNGSTCRSCTEQALQSSIARLDSSSLDQSRRITKALREIKTGNFAKKAARLRKKASDLYTKNWSLIWGSLKDTDDRCAQYSGCQIISTESVTAQSKIFAEKLYRVGLQAAALVEEAKIPNSDRKKAKITRDVTKLFQNSSSFLDAYPKNTHECD